jgi:hypothetical protein
VSGLFCHYLLKPLVPVFGIDRHYHGSGHVWQGRFKAFPVQEDDHLRSVLRYIERNPLRAGLVVRAEHWPWSSLSRPDGPPTLDPGPAPVPFPRYLFPLREGGTGTLEPWTIYHLNDAMIKKVT